MKGASLEGYECARCGTRFCPEHSEYLFFFGLEIGSSGFYATSPDASRSEREEAEQAFAQMEYNFLKEWMHSAEERGLTPAEWEKIQFFEDGMEQSGPGWYFCNL